MPRAKKQNLETKSGLFSLRSAGRPYVRVREEKVKGAPIVFDYKDPRTGLRVKPAVQPLIVVRDSRGKLVGGQVERAQKAADDRSAALRLNRERDLAEPARLTLASAYERYFDPHEGALPREDGKKQGRLLKHSKPYAAGHARSRDFWLRELGPNKAWNSITPAQVDAAATRGKDQHGVEAVIQFVERLSTVANWLRDKADLDVKNPARSFDPAKYRHGVTPRRPRYTEDELERLIQHSRGVDPRFRLLFCFADSSGSRGGQIREAWRSQLDAPLPVTPSHDDAPHGWIAFRGVKGQAAHLVFLTDFQRVELAGALGGYCDEADARWKPGHLSEMEEHYLSTGTDYPLFPGGFLRGGIARLRGSKGQSFPSRPLGATTALAWLHDTERAAGIPPVEQRGLHGIRRAWAKYTRRMIGKSAASHAGGWSNEATMEGIYVGERYEDLAAAREAQQARRNRQR